MDLILTSVRVLKKNEDLLSTGTYKGVALNELYEKFVLADNSDIEPSGEGIDLSETGEDFQECYLGYVADKDLFVSGFDCFLDNESRQRTCENAVFWKINDDGELQILNKQSYGRAMWYSGKGGYANLQKQYKSLIDIRLD